jgi:rRNA large subunit m3Psi methyltransferase RlmH
MEVVIHTPGRLAVPGTDEGVREYVRRISDWNLRHEPSFPGDKASDEARVGLDADGTMTTTEGIHKWLNGRADGGVDCVRFLIGGKEGLSSSDLSRCDWTWSLGPLVMNQSIAALVVAEQCYRSYCLRTGHPYHET